MLLSSMAFVGCVSDVSDSNYTYDKLNAQYAQKFEQTFGKIAANQDWGFDAAVMRGATASEEDLKGYVIPDEMTKNEGEAAYTAVFSASDDQYKGMKVSLADIMKVVDLKNYYLQYVGTKNNNTHINSQTYSNGAVFEDMESIEAYDYNNKKWVEVQNFEKGQYKKKFFKKSNIVAHNLMFMMDMGTPDGNQPQFRWKSKTSKNPKKDVEPYYYDYDFLKIGDDYFVMLYYIDSPRAGWLIRIGTAEKEEEDPVAQRGRIFCEDLGESNVSDFDFNDVVFDAVIYKDGHIDIEILAAGGTLPVEVFYDGEAYDMTPRGQDDAVSIWGEIHDAFGEDVTTVINTIPEGMNVKNLNSATCEPLNAVFFFGEDFLIQDDGIPFYLVVDGKFGQKRIAAKGPDGTPQAIVIGTTWTRYPGTWDEEQNYVEGEKVTDPEFTYWQWPIECVDVEAAYPDIKTCRTG